MRNLLIGVSLATGLMTGMASAATLKVEVWDVNAPLDGEYGGNPATTPLGTFEIGGPNFLDGTGDSVQAAIGSRVADATFTIDSADLAAGFGSNFGNSGPGNSSETIGGFFGLGTAPNTNGVLGNFLLGTVARITGFATATAGDKITIESDDGWQFSYGGVSHLNTGNFGPGSLQPPGSADTITFGNEATGQNKGFELLWFEANTVAAQLQLTVPQGTNTQINPIPLPAGAWLLGGALAGLGFARRRKAKKS